MSIYQVPAKDEKQAKFFAIDAEMRSRAAYDANIKFFTSQTQKAKVLTVMQILKNMLRVNNNAYYEKIFETPRQQKANGVFTDVTVFKFMPNRYVRSSDIVNVMQQLGFTAKYSPRSGNIKIVVK